MGRVAPRGEAILVIDGDVVVGRITRDHDAIFQITSLGDGVHAIAELDPDAFPRD